MFPRARILVIDDDEQVLELVQDVLESRFDVLGIGDPFEGLELLRREKFDLLILDLGMPNLDGAQLIGLVRTNSVNTEIPILVMSAFDELRRKVAHLPVQDVVTKPFDLEALEKKVKEVVA
ncbi:MAG: response regulator [Rudaea sp.]